jgi:flagellar assembly protein FliH
MDNNRNRIPAVETTEYSSWAVPEINDGQIFQVVHSGDHQPGAAAKKTAGPQDDADKVLTEDQIQQLSNEARQQGYQQGLEQGIVQGESKGYKVGLDKGEKEIKQRIAQLQQLKTHLMAPLQEQDNNLEQILLALVKTIAETVIKQELEDNRVDIIRRVISDAIAALPIGAANIRIYLNPDDLAALQGEGAELDPTWQLCADKLLSVGGCRIETAQSLVDYRVEMRVRQVVEQLMENAGVTSFSEEEPKPARSADSEIQ